MRSKLATRDKAHREDQALDARAPAQHAPHDPWRDDEEDGPELHTRSSALWLGIAQGSASEEKVAREGTRGTGGELPYREELEQSLGVDLSQVKAFTGADARRAADQLGAEAYALRDDQAIVFGDDSPSKELVAHEVVHTLQQGTGAVSQDEEEADAIAARVAAGEQIGAEEIQSGGGKVRKKEKTNFKQWFDDSLDSGPYPEAEDPEAVEHIPGKDKLIEQSLYETKEFGIDGSFSSTRWGNGVSFKDGTLNISSEHVERAGTIDPRQAVVTAIDNARFEVLSATVLNRLGHRRVMAEQKGLEHDLKKLDDKKLDPVLVAAMRNMLQRKIDAASSRAAELDKELEDLDDFREELAGNEARLAYEDPEKIALALAQAEATFIGTTTTRRQSFGFNALAGTLSRSKEEERAVTAQTGTSTTTRSSTTTVKLGGGASVGSTDHLREAHTDNDGNVSATERSVTSTRKVIAREDGTVGIGGGHKLAGAIEDSRLGKVMGNVGLDGAVTVNIIELPQGEEEKKRYAVVVTIDVGLAAHIGLEREGAVAKEGTDAKKAGKDHPAKVKGAFSAHGGASGQLTHTRVFDEQQTKRYLTHLDRVASGGKPASSEPELDMLYKALRGLENADDITKGVFAQFGSSDAARSMAVDESIELTGKVSSGADASLGVGAIGASGGGAGERFRTLKLGRVAGKPGQELVEITVSFGDSSDLHGALTGSALGVTATAGIKKWGSSQDAVTFRLDATQPDYAELYDEIVGTWSRDRLIELRTSRRFIKHVQAYTSSTSTGGETSVAIEGHVGVRAEQSHARSSQRGMSDGELTLSEEGTQTRSTGLSVGPIELLRRSQTDGARFEVEGDISTLDISERTSSTSIGKFDFSAKDFVTSESPAKAIEKALLETQNKLAGIHLEPDDLDALVHRAKNAQAWSNVIYHVDNGKDGNAEAWNKLRLDLVKPKIPNDPSVPIHLVRDLALATAVADFVASSSGAKGADYLNVALRKWGRAGGGDNTALGTLYEFPFDVSAVKYKEVRLKCKRLPDTLSAFVPDREAGLESGLIYIAELQYDLATVLKSVEESYGFDSERTRIEMIAELRDLAADIPAVQRDFQRQCTGIEPSISEQSQDATDDTQARVQALEKTLEKSKLSERWLFDRLTRRVRDYKHGKRADEMTPLLENLEEMYGAHTLLIKQLRVEYKIAQQAGLGLPVRCSMAPADERRELDIDYVRFETMYKLRAHALPYGIGTYNLENEINNRRNRYRFY